MGHKEFENSRDNIREIGAFVEAAIQLGEGVSLVVPPDVKQPMSPSSIRWGDEAFNGNEELVLELGKGAVLSVPEYHAVLHVMKVYREAQRTEDALEADRRAGLFSTALIALCNQFTARWEGKD